MKKTGRVDDDGEMDGPVKLVDIEAEMVGSTELAFRLYDGSKTKWVPRRYVEYSGDGKFAMPYWLAKEKGFI